MENNPKKSKALIITIILILLLLVAGYFIFKNNSFFGVKSSTNTELNSLPPSNNSQGFFSKIFAPLTTSSNSKSLATGQNGNIGNAEAGEDIAQGDSVYKFGVNKSNFPVVKKIDPKNTNKFGTSLGNYKTGQLGSFLITDKSFWGKIKDWVGGIFGYNPADNKCANGATNYPLCNNNGTDLGTFPNVIVSANPMFVSSGQSSTVTWSSTNTTSCNAGAGNGIGTSGSFSTGPLTASKSFTVICNGPKGASSGNVLITVGTAVCINNATNPPECTTGVNKCTNGADNFPTCTTLNGACLNGATNPEACTTGGGGNNCLNGATNPPLCDNGATKCTNGADNFPTCTTIGGACINNATNPPECTTIVRDETLPTVTVMATPQNIAKGESSTISWTSTNSTSCNAGTGRGTGTTGSFGTGALTSSRSYTVTCTGANGTGGGNVIVLVEGTVGSCLNGATNPPLCDNGATKCTNGADNFPTCTTLNGACLNGATNPEACTTGGGGNNCLNGATNPPLCDNGATKCTNGADNFPTCTTLNGACLNGATNPEACTTGEDNMPSVTVTATPQTITYGGTSSISWKSENTTACTLSGGGITGTGTTNSGVSTGKLTKDMSYTVKCTRANESTSGTVFVTVELNKFPSVQIEANPETIPYNGSSTISWTSTNAVSCAASVPIDTVEGGESVSTTNGSFSTGALTESRSYVVSCEGLPGTGSSSATVLVFVNPEIIPIVPECRDGISNNDNDTLVDSADPECHKDGNPKNNDSYDPDWYSESVPWGYKPQCSDGIDNDWDRLIDIQDPNCHTDGIALDNNASRGTAGLVDENGQSPVETYNAKTYDPNILSESGSAPAPVGYTECSDGKENDGDEKIDINDPQCHIGGKMEGLFVPTHDSESISPKQCDDTIDNDRDHKKDIDDEGCHTNGILGEPYIPLWNDEETPPSACNDGIDNDGDWKIDIQDPQCHIDGKLENEYVPTNSSELDAPMSPNICLDIEQNPITFTDEEKARLAVLLRKFYLISSTLRTSEDISTIYNEIDQQNNFMDQIDGLSKQCYLQTKDSYGFNNFCIRNPKSCDTNFLAEFEAEANTKYNDSFYGTRTSDLAQDMRHGNPWYQPSYQYHNPSGAFPYSRTGAVAYTDYNWLEGNYEYNINGTYSSARVQQTGNYYSTGDGPGCKAVSGYYYGTLVEDVSFINPPIPIGSDTNQEGDYEYQVTSGTRGASCYDLFNKFAFQYCTTANSTQNKCSGNNIKTRYTSQSCSNMSTKIFGTMKAPPREELLKAGCKWKDGVILENAERILNIW